MPRLRTKVLTVAVASALALVCIAPPAYAVANLNVSVSGTDGSGTSALGSACVDGGSGDTWSFDYGPVVAAAGMFTQTQQASVNLALDFHAEPTQTSPSRTYSKGFFGPNAFITLTNTRGSVQLPISPGACSNPTITFDGSSLSGSSTWSEPVGTGAYRDMTGSGIFTLQATVKSLTTSYPFSLNVQGQITVLAPAVSIAATNAEWATTEDYINRRLTVTYSVKNTGVGDAFGVTLQSVTPTTGGVTTNFSGPKSLGDILAGNTRNVKVVFKLAKDDPPCARTYAYCHFTADLTFRVPDALDAPLSPNPVLSTSVTPPY
jgi:hypothetical protein